MLWDLRRVAICQTVPVTLPSKAEIGAYLWTQTSVFYLIPCSPFEDLSQTPNFRILNGLMTLKFLSAAFPSLQKFLAICSYLPTGHSSGMPVLLLFLVHSTLDELNAPYFYQWYFYPINLKRKKNHKSSPKFHWALLHSIYSMNSFLHLAHTPGSTLDWLADADPWRSHSYDPNWPIFLKPQLLLCRFLAQNMDSVPLKENICDG